MLKIVLGMRQTALVWNKKSVLRLTNFCANSRPGRNNSGRITVRHRSSRLVKTRTRLVSKNLFFFTNEFAQILRIERTGKAFIALARLIRSGFLCYIKASATMLLGSFVALNPTKINFNSFNKLNIKSVALPIFRVPRGRYVCNLENKFLSGAKLCCSAGAKAKVQSISYKTGLASVLLPSGKSVLLNLTSHAFVGVMSNAQLYLGKLYKAGQSRWKGYRPTVRGVAMNPIDHPHGGGEGKTSGGRPSVTPWGKITKGARTSSSGLKKKNNVLKIKFLSSLR